MVAQLISGCSVVSIRRESFCQCKPTTTTAVSVWTVCRSRQWSKRWSKQGKADQSDINKNKQASTHRHTQSLSSAVCHPVALDTFWKRESLRAESSSFGQRYGIQEHKSTVASKHIWHILSACLPACLLIPLVCSASISNTAASAPAFNGHHQ